MTWWNKKCKCYNWLKHNVKIWCIKDQCWIWIRTCVEKWVHRFMTIAEGCTIFFKWNNKVATVAALLGIEESRTLWAVWGTRQLHIGGYRSVRSGEWLVTVRGSSSDNPWTSPVNHPCLCLIAPISQHIMLPQWTVATALIFNWTDEWAGRGCYCFLMRWSNSFRGRGRGMRQEEEKWNLGGRRQEEGKWSENQTRHRKRTDAAKEREEKGGGQIKRGESKDWSVPVCYFLYSS